MLGSVTLATIVEVFYMRVSILFAIFLLAIESFLFAQDDVNKYNVELGTSFGITSLNQSKVEISTRDLNVSFGYDINNRFTVRIPLILTTGLFKNTEANIKDHRVTGTVGLSAGYNALVNPMYRIQLAGEFGHTLNRKDDPWSFFYYDAGGRLYLGETKDRANAVIGIGIKHTLSDSKSRDGFLIPYVSIGVRLNMLKRK